ncbi:UPF0496 protein At3g19330-like isoform X1 [Rhodamnia argentea]|uniref:UPF0496 protein At3g19330-like isoform X1 n=1 Tax=Rhodamnia argentea TaxID=178133 RepID=A0A8B8MMU9_9MYRT|nr:UPF0496 protein At3g19330-like isoform X1 [Rhodamnia argentea]
MLTCLSAKPSSSPLPNSHLVQDLDSHPPPSLGTSPGGTSRSSQAVSPTVNLTREYTLALQTNSYNEIRSAIYVLECSQGEQELRFQEQDFGESTQEQVLLRVLQPNRECVGEALRHAKDNALTRLVSSYFDHSENTSNLCLLLYQSLHRARDMYSPLVELLGVLPLDADSFTRLQCDRVYEVFVQFHRYDNPFPSRDSQNFSEMRSCFSQLKQQLDHRLTKSKSRVKYVRRAIAGSALCLFGTVVGAVATAIGVTAHALVAFVGAPCLMVYLPQDKFSKKELAHAAQLDAAARVTFFLKSYLDTIDPLVDRLHLAVEDDKQLIQIGLERCGMDKNPILEVVKHLRKNHTKFLDDLKDVEDHTCLCFNMVNKARKLLLEEIMFHSSIAS